MHPLSTQYFLLKHKGIRSGLVETDVGLSFKWILPLYFQIFPLIQIQDWNAN